MRPPIAIIDTGVANLASVRAALARCSVESLVTRDADVVERAAGVVLPGVGAFGAGMARLEGAGLVEPLRERVRTGGPLLAICLGMQLFFEASEESPGVRGLGFASGFVRVFPSTVMVPQFGWNAVRDGSGCGVGDGVAYFANSYRVTDAPEGWSCAWGEHGGRFVAAMSRGGVLACQFHPELSGAYGHGILSAWCARTREEVSC